jgi:hypothetical protein
VWDCVSSIFVKCLWICISGRIHDGQTKSSIVLKPFSFNQNVIFFIHVFLALFHLLISLKKIAIVSTIFKQKTRTKPFLVVGGKGDYFWRFQKIIFYFTAKKSFQFSFWAGGQYYKLFTAVIKPLAVYFSMILTELRQ